MISLLLTVLIAALLFWLVAWALSQLALPQPVRTVVLVALAIVFIVWLARQLGVL